MAKDVKDAAGDAIGAALGTIAALASKAVRKLAVRTGGAEAGQKLVQWAHARQKTSRSGSSRKRSSLALSTPVENRTTSAG
jgi:hypothetical protein